MQIADRWQIAVKKMPFVRLLMMLIAGILLQWYANLSLAVISIASVIVALPVILFSLFPAFTRYNLQWLRGLAILLSFTSGGAFVSYLNNIQHNKDWFQHQYKQGAIIIATINEPLVSKPKSYKAVAEITALYDHHQMHDVTGSVIIYFKKDSPPNVQYGSQIAFTKPVQSISNSGNPGEFDYKRYLLFQQVTGQVFLQQSDYVILPDKNASSFQIFLQNIRQYVVQSLQTYIPGKKEQGVAEALLIGYRNDLDKQLVQSYSNTGVVHIIAISGLHLGMIYGVILWLFSPNKRKSWYRFVMPATVIVVLWLFTFIAGAVPSILRSAVMFTFIVSAKFLQRKTNIYNTLAASAFCLLIYNPYYLWDVGFQLSYAAVLSIVMLMKPVYNLLYFDNKIINAVWKLAAVNMAAQIFTVPIVLYYFHQLPLLFLITNLLVIPLSTIILFATIVIVLLAKLPVIIMLIGSCTTWLLQLMNNFVQFIEKLPFALWSNIKVDIVQTCLSYVIIILLTIWLLYKMPKAFVYGAVCLLVFVAYTVADVIQAKKQRKLIVYNLPGHSNIEILQGNHCMQLCDATLLQDAQLQSFYLKPAHVQQRITTVAQKLLGKNNYTFSANNKRIIILNSALPDRHVTSKIKAGVIIITHNPKIYMKQLQVVFDCRLIVADNTNPLWKIEQWKKDCDSLHLRLHSTAKGGAVVMDL